MYSGNIEKESLASEFAFDEESKSVYASDSQVLTDFAGSVSTMQRFLALLRTYGMIIVLAGYSFTYDART